MSLIYIRLMPRRRRNDISYTVKTITPQGEEHIKVDLDTLEEIADYINQFFFNSFPVVSRSMINNWVDNKPRRSFANNFHITKTQQ